MISHAGKAINQQAELLQYLEIINVLTWNDPISTAMAIKNKFAIGPIPDME